MTLFEYLDTKFRNLSLELQTNYSIQKEAELKAAYSLIQIQRSVFKCLIMPVLFVKYVLINIKLLKPPVLLTAPKKEAKTQKVESVQQVSAIENSTAIN